MADKVVNVALLGLGTARIGVYKQKTLLEN